MNKCDIDISGDENKDMLTLLYRLFQTGPCNVKYVNWLHYDFYNINSKCDELFHWIRKNYNVELLP